MRELLLALDLGTTRVRALLVEPGGGVRGRAAAALGARYPAPGRVEQDPGEMWSLSRDLLREALRAGGAGARDVAALGLVTQRSTVVAWEGGAETPLVPAQGWQDQRTAPRVAELRARGVPVTTQASAPKLEWWLRHEPAVAAAARRGRLRLGTPDAWLTERLTGGAAFVTDPGHASCTGLADLARGDWHPAALDFFGVPREALPTVVGTAEPVGETPAGLLGAPVPVAARAGDQQAACFAQGVLREGQAKLTLGTSAMLDRHAGARPPRPAAGTWPLALWRLPGAGCAFCLEGTVLTAGAAVEWLVELGLLPEAAALDRTAGAVPDAGGVVFVPALQGLGSPWLDDAARGLLAGLTRGASAPQVVRAVLEGVAQRCVDLCDAVGLGPDALPVDGGLAASDLLCRTLADLSGRTLLRAAELETTALGAAALAGLAVGLLRDPEAAAALVGPPRAFAPARDDAWREARRARWHAALERTRG